MTNNEFALSDLAARLAGADASLSTALRDITAALQELIEAELTASIGAASGERTPERTALRNGHRSKLVSTPAGDVEIGIPKLPTGSFFPELLEPRRRIDKALWAVIMTAYITGTSTRKVDDLVKARRNDRRRTPLHRRRVRRRPHRQPRRTSVTRSTPKLTNSSEERTTFYTTTWDAIWIRCHLRQQPCNDSSHRGTVLDGRMSTEESRHEFEC